MKLDVLAIGAHPDDIELTCSGTLIKMVGQGRKVGILDLTEGELGTRGNRKVRAREAAAAASLIGVSVRQNIGLPDGNIEATLKNRLKVVRILRALRPDVLLLPYPVDRHPDHEHAHTLAREAWFLSGLEKVTTAERGRAQEPFRPRAYYYYMQWQEFEPSFIVDVTAQYDRRLQVVKAYRSQFYDPANNESETILSTPDFMDRIRTRLEYYGDKIGTTYGEPFGSPAALRIDDLFTLNS
jgi:bacillithiol biosynthesis deacetylase BshB1